MVLGMAIALGAGIAIHDRVREEYYLRKLESGDEEEKKIAVERLGEMKSPVVIPRLLELIKKDPRAYAGFWSHLVRGQRR